jgi:hypothetical protein
LHIEFWWGIVKKGDHLEEQGYMEDNIKKILIKKQNGKARTGLIWLRRGTWYIGRSVTK